MEYTKRETEEFIYNRNRQAFLYREEKRNRPKLVHLSQSLVPMKDPITGKGLPFLVKKFAKGKTFVGSIRKQFTGEKRCGITNHL